ESRLPRAVDAARQDGARPTLSAMAVPPRLLLLAVGVAPVVLITACADDATGSRTTIAEVQPTSYVVEDPVTTTTTTTAPPVQGGNGTATDPNEQTYTVQSGDS